MREESREGGREGGREGNERGGGKGIRERVSKGERQVSVKGGRI